jgi:hypothetical protein
MTDYNWSGLRLWRVAFAAALLLFLPVSCVAVSALSPFVSPPFVPGLLVGMLVVVGSLYGLRHWPCPRCGSGFTNKRGEPLWVAPWASQCLGCGLPEFTANEAEAPPIVFPATPQTIVDSEESKAVEKMRKRRTRVALLFAVPLVYLTMCRLPAGEIVKAASGREIQMLGIMRNTVWRSGEGTTESVDVSYYVANPNDTSEMLDVLSVIVPMVAQTDSLIRISQVKNNWWIRNSGIRISEEHAFRRQTDGTWAKVQ